MHSAMGGIYVVDKLPSSDHLPLVVTFSMKVVDKARVTSAHANKGNEACQTTDWSNATANCKPAYAAESHRILGDVCETGQIIYRSITVFINSLFSTTAGVLLLDERIHVTICMIIHSIYYQKNN